MKKISIIVPVYNTEKYLRKCLDSLLNQTMEEIEVIVINDGSTDGSSSILDEYQIIYPEKMQIIHQKNCGISATRNRGIRAAQGEYITFIDSDDSIDEKFCEVLYTKISEEKLDVVVCDYYEVNEETQDKNYKKIENFNTGSVYTDPHILFDINTSPWNKLYKREFLTRNHIEFPIGIKYEDAVFWQGVLANEARIGQISVPLLYYLVRAGSETTVVKGNVFDIFKVLNLINEKYQCVKREKYNKVKEYLEYFNINRITVYNLQQIRQENEELVTKFINEGFVYLSENFPRWKQNKLFISDNSCIERLIKSSKLLTKIYVAIIRKVKYGK